jgi:hypothetical protein
MAGLMGFVTVGMSNYVWAISWWFIVGSPLKMGMSFGIIIIIILILILPIPRALLATTP